MYEGLVTFLAGETVGGILSWPVSILPEACTQVALTVGFGRARGPVPRQAYGWHSEPPSPLPAIDPDPQCQGVEAGL